jgi:cell division protein FtsW (lipid II flippase)
MKIGAKIRHVIPLTNITPAIIAANTNVVPRSFCSNIILGILYAPALIENLLGVQLYQMGRINSWLDPYTYHHYYMYRGQAMN